MKLEGTNTEGQALASGSEDPPHRRCNFCSSPLMPGGLKHCTCCKSVFYCNKSCQSKHWKDHSALCKAIEVLDSQHSERVRNAGVYTSHLTPREHERVVKLVGVDAC